MSAGNVYIQASALTRASRRVREATEQRDRIIREMRVEGYSLRGIAKFAELSHTAVAKIAARSID